MICRCFSLSTQKGKYITCVTNIWFWPHLWYMRQWISYLKYVLYISYEVCSQWFIKKGEVKKFWYQRNWQRMKIGSKSLCLLLCYVFASTKWFLFKGFYFRYVVQRCSQRCSPFLSQLFLILVGILLFLLLHADLPHLLISSLPSYQSLYIRKWTELIEVVTFHVTIRGDICAVVVLIWPGRCELPSSSPQDHQKDLTSTSVTSGNDLVIGTQMSMKHICGVGSWLEDYPECHKYPICVENIRAILLKVQNAKTEVKMVGRFASGIDKKAVDWVWT